ncbi:unnamed protein product, partial [Allacma fusca]
FYNLFEY